MAGLPTRGTHGKERVYTFATVVEFRGVAIHSQGDSGQTVTENHAQHGNEVLRVIPRAHVHNNVQRQGGEEERTAHDGKETVEKQARVGVFGAFAGGLRGEERHQHPNRQHHHRIMQGKHPSQDQSDQQQLRRHTQAGDEDVSTQTQAKPPRQPEGEQH